MIRHEHCAWERGSAVAAALATSSTVDETKALLLPSTAIAPLLVFGVLARLALAGSSTPDHRIIRHDTRSGSDIAALGKLARFLCGRLS